MNFKRMIGEKCYLSPVDPCDFEKFTTWFNDFEVLQYLTTTHKVFGLQAEKKILEDMANSGTPSFSIVDIETNVVIGVCDLHNISYADSTADLGIVIGDKNFWNRGYGKDAVSLLVDYGFNIKNLENIMLQVHEYNPRAIKCYENVGFKVIGSRRNARKFAGKMSSVIYMDIIPEDFESPFVKKAFEKSINQDSHKNVLEIVLD